MKKKIVLLIMIPMILTACNLAKSVDKENEIQDSQIEDSIDSLE